MALPSSRSKLIGRTPQASTAMSATARPDQMASPPFSVFQHGCGAIPMWTPSWVGRSEEHTSELQSLMRISYAVFCLKKKKNCNIRTTNKELHTNTTKREIYTSQCITK